MRKLLIFVLALSSMVILMSASSCEKQVTRRDVEEQRVEDNVKTLSSQTELPTLTKSLERINIKKRLQLFEDENKVSYIYLVSYGKVMAFYTVKGKVTSGNKRLTSNQTQTEGKYTYGESRQTVLMDAPELDGTYGSSAPYIYFWTTDGTYVQWSSDYMLCDKPLKMSTQPELIRQIN